jgi:hypothetical protein
MRKPKLGRPTGDGATNVKRIQVSLDPGTLSGAKKLGNGVVSRGIREAVRVAIKLM